MDCKKCGNKHNEENKFCTSCGVPVRKSSFDDPTQRGLLTVGVLVLIVVIYALSKDPMPEVIPFGNTTLKNEQISQETDITESIILGADSVISGNFTLSQTWFDYGSVLTKNEVVPLFSDNWHDDSTNGKFAFVIIKAKNTGLEIKAISVNDVTFTDDKQRVYKPYILSDYRRLAFIYDENNKKVPVAPMGNFSISIQPGIEEERAILFEVAKDSNGANVGFKKSEL